jgi:hypothetical protein
MENSSVYNLQETLATMKLEKKEKYEKHWHLFKFL